MKREFIFLLLCCFSFVLLAAQSIQKNQYQFHSINSVGLINGSNGVSVAVQSVNGFKKGSWFAGVGIGLDYYQYRTVPLFADLRYEWGKKRSKFFMYGNAGINFSWVQDYLHDDPEIWNGNRSNDFNNGLYTDAGIGLSAEFKNGNAFILSLGRSRKTMGEKITYQDWRTGTRQTDVNKYRFNSMILKTGFRF